MDIRDCNDRKVATSLYQEVKGNGVETNVT